MTEMEYNAAEGIRRSDLWLIDDSPAKFKWKMEHPEEEEKTAALIFGSAAHKYVLEPEEFDREYCTAPVVDRRTKEGKKAWEDFIAANEGKTVISPDDLETMHEMASVIRETPLAARYLDGQHEVPFFWKDKETGEKCKCKADCIRAEDGRIVVVDYKTAQSAQTMKFNAEIFKRGYHVQAAMYTEGVKEALGLDYRPGFVFVVQEKKAPYAMNVIDVTEEVMDYGESVYHKLLRTYHDCKTVDIWEGYITGDVPNDSFLPTWMQAAMEDEL